MNKITKVLFISFFTNTILSLAKIVFGLINKSQALVADGFHSLSDLLTDLVAIVGYQLSLKPADRKHPFGHGKIEYVTSLVVGMVIVVLGGLLIYNAFNTDIVKPSLFLAVLILIVIVAKYVLATYILNKGIKYKNNILIASGKESKADVYSSILVLASIILMQFSDKISILKYTDIFGTIIIAIIIIKTGFDVLKENIGILLEEQVTDFDHINKVEDIILYFEEVISIDLLHILRYGPYYKLIANITMNENIKLSEAHKIVDMIEEKIKNEDSKIKYVFIHMEPQKIDK